MSYFSIFLILFSVQFWFLIFVIFLIQLMIKSWLIRKKLPPGPTKLPFIHSFLSFGPKKIGIHETALELSKKFGDPITVFIGNTPWVIISKYKLAKYVLDQPNFSSRPPGFAEFWFDGTPDITFAPFCPQWQFHRKIISKCMKEIMNQTAMEIKIVDSVDSTVEDMLKHADKLNPTTHLHYIVCNVFEQFANGKTYEIDDEEFVELQNLHYKVNEDFSRIQTLNTFPFSKYIFRNVRSWPLNRIPMIKRMLDTMERIKSVRMGQIKKHMQTYTDGQIRDLTDAIICEQKILLKQCSEEAAWLTEKNISLLLYDFFTGGTDSISETLTWWCLFMIMHPDIQEECYQTIQAVIGDQAPQLSDRSKMTFVDATILETMRRCPNGPLATPHTAMSDAKIGDYFIPEGTIVLPNIYAMHIDPEHWEDPLQFKPRQHFLDENNELRKRTSYGPFCFGRRVCVGEQWAKNYLFLIIVRLLQRVRLEPLPNFQYNLDYSKDTDGVLIPLPYFLKVTARK